MDGRVPERIRKASITRLFEDKSLLANIDGLDEYRAINGCRNGRESADDLSSWEKHMPRRLESLESLADVDRPTDEEVEVSKLSGRHPP